MSTLNFGQMNIGPVFVVSTPPQFTITAEPPRWVPPPTLVITTNCHSLKVLYDLSDFFPGSVVNHELKVYGVRGLRVIDASIMPKIPSGNTNAPTIMVGEKGADLVKEYWYSKKKRRKRDESGRASDLFSDWPEKIGPSKCQPDKER